jgi:hypothetical protein
MGAGLETFDAIGRAQTTDLGHALTGRGVVPPLMDRPDEQAFTGAQELGRLLSGSLQTRECLMSHVHRALVGRESVVSEVRELDAARARFVGSGDLRALVTDLLAGQETSRRF